MRRAGILLAFAATWLVLLGAATDASRKPASAPGPAPRPVSIKDSPGYYPPADPESTSERIGRRLNAPLVSKPFQGGARSLELLGRSVLRVLHRSDRDSLLALCIREDEFRDILWREFPQSRPAVGLTWLDAWKVLLIRLNAGCRQAVSDYGGHRYDFIALESDSTMRYRNFTIHSRITLVARDEEGQVHRMHWLRAVAERKGRFKIYSTTD